MRPTGERCASRSSDRCRSYCCTRIHQALGGLERLEGLIRVDGYVASADTFVDQPEVLDGASELFLWALGERGKHARTAFLMTRLPKNNSVELRVTFAYDSSP